jgi:hypothetical protein
LLFFASVGCDAACAICFVVGGVIKPTRCVHSRLPPLRRTQERGTRRVADYGKIKNLGHPPPSLGLRSEIDWFRFLGLFDAGGLILDEMPIIFPRRDKLTKLD